MYVATNLYRGRARSKGTKSLHNQLALNNRTWYALAYRTAVSFEHASRQIIGFSPAAVKCLPAKKSKSSVICFSVAERVGVREVHRRMKIVYEEHALSLTRVQDWHKRFREGRESMKDSDLVKLTSSLRTLWWNKSLGQSAQTDSHHQGRQNRCGSEFRFRTDRLQYRKVGATLSHRRLEEPPYGIVFAASSEISCRGQFPGKDCGRWWILVPSLPTRNQTTKPTMETFKLPIVEEVQNDTE